MIVRLIVELFVEPFEGDTLPPTKQVRESVQAAVVHALKYGEGEGFIHPLDNEIAIWVEDVRLEATLDAD